jgi:hypothetical protein
MNFTDADRGKRVRDRVRRQPGCGSGYGAILNTVPKLAVPPEEVVP